jgi:hypothetical protein
MADFRSLALAVVLGVTAIAPPAAAHSGGDTLGFVLGEILIGVFDRPAPAPQPQQPMRWIDQRCLSESNSVVCQSAALRNMAQYNRELQAAYLSRLSGPAAEQFMAQVRQGEAQYKAECNAAVADLQACTVKWLSYFGQLYSAKPAALSAPSRAPPLQLSCRTVLADWQTDHFFQLHPQVTYDQGVAMAKECLQRHPAAARQTVPASYPPQTPLNRSMRIAGEITEATIAQFDVSILRDPNINTVVLDSPGGRVIASRDLAMRIRRLHLTTLVPANAECASACFMLFAAGTQRIAGASARIGVHSAALDGEETGVTLAMSTLMARQCGAFGVPPAILGKMVTTAPDGMEWLSADELRSMQVEVE